MKVRQLFFSIFLTLLLSSSLAVSSIFALDKPPKGSIGVEPAYLDVTLDKNGPQKQIEFIFSNNSDAPISLDISAIDFKQKDETGIVTFLGEQSNIFSYSLASFLSFETNRLDIDPNSSKKLRVLVKNRSDVSPGGHYAAVVGRLIQDTESQKSTVLPSVSALIYLNKTGGERYKLALRGVQWPESFVVFGYPKVINLDFSNDGNIHLIPHGRIEIRDIWGRLIQRGTVNENSARIFPETRRLIETQMINVERSLPFSINTFSIAGEDSLKKTSYAHRESFIFIDPALVALIIILIFTFVYSRYSKWRKKH